MGDKDLAFFKERVEQPGEVEGAGPWESMVYKDFGSFTYEAWRRSLTVRHFLLLLMLFSLPFECFSTYLGLAFWRACREAAEHEGKEEKQRLSGVPGAMQNGKTEYKSVTVAEDSTAEEFMDFYLDDDTRTTWVITSDMPSLPQCCLHELACIHGMSIS